MPHNDSHVFTRKFQGKVWKTLVSSTGEHIAIEVREESTHQVSFYILDVLNRSWTWEEVTFKEQWWISLEYFGETQLVFTYYEDGASPEHKQELIIDIYSREVLSDIEAQSSSATTYQASLHYVHGQDYFATVEKFLRQRFNILPKKAVDYMEGEDFIAISYYLWQAEKLANYLLILEQNGEIKHHVALADQLTSVGIDTFFRLEKSIYTIRNKNEFLVYDL